MNEVFVKTEDNVKIALNYYNNGCDTVIIVAPGWCMTKDSNAFRCISESFAEKYDVITFDFRGHGRSSGLYTFTSKELFDADAVVKFAEEKKYKIIIFAGFSLGAAIAIIYAAKNKNIDKVIAVSPPCDFDKIENRMWRKEAWAETFKKFELKRFCSIRPNPFMMKKIKPVDVIKDLKVPVLFISGEKDPTVFPWHTELLFKESECEKKYFCFKGGCHAEDLYLHHKDEFMSICFNLTDN